MFVVNTLEKDTQFKLGIEYVLATVLAYQGGCRIDPSKTYPLDLEIDEITVTIAERCQDYIVGEQSNQSTGVTNPYATTPIINVAQGYRPQFKSRYKPRAIIDKSIACQACMGQGHCATNPETICYAPTKAHLCEKFIAKPANLEVVKYNTNRYKKSL